MIHELLKEILMAHMGRKILNPKIPNLYAMEIPNLSTMVGKTITIQGMISNCPWQHLIQPSKEYPKEFYFDLPNHFQIVVYAKQNLPESCQLQLTGIIVEIHGGPKHPKTGLTKVDASYSEYQMLVNKWQIVT